MINSSVKFALIVVSFVSVLVGFAGSAKADPDPCASLKAAYATCTADAKADCKSEADKVSACVSAYETCKGDVEAMAGADAKCKQAYDDRHKDDDKKVAPAKPIPLVCDAPASKKSKGYGCECPVGLFPVSVWGKAGHVSCATPKDLSGEVAKLQSEMNLLHKKQLTPAERGELKAYEEKIARFYLVDPKTGNSVLPDYAKLFVEWETFKLAFKPWKESVDEKIARLEGRMDGVEGRLTSVEGVTGELMRRGKGVFVRPELGGELIFRKGGDTTWALPAVGAGLYAPVAESVTWFVRGSIGYGKSGGLESVGVGRAGTGFTFALSESVTLGPEVYFRFIGRYEALKATDGSTLIAGGKGGHAGGLAANFHVRATDIIGFGFHAGAELQNNEWATCTISKSCYRQESGIGASIGASLTFSFGAPPLR